jgi:hypothetical protein
MSNWHLKTALSPNHRAPSYSSAAEKEENNPTTSRGEMSSYYRIFIRGKITMEQMRETTNFSKNERTVKQS